MKQLIVAVGALVASHAAFGMTQAELQSAIDAAESGATVEVTSDVTISSALSFAKAVTLRSAAGQTNVITRSQSTRMLSFSDNAEVRLENIVIDGNGKGKIQGACTTIASGSTLTFGAGTVIRDFDVGTQNGGILISPGARLCMEDGAEIRGFRGSSWANVVQIGQSTTLSSATFDMTGGLITDCAGTTGTAGVGYDGVVYVYGGTFNMSGGLITGNTSAKSVAGLDVYAGYVLMSGTATITNNIGGLVNDVVVNNEDATVRKDHAGFMNIADDYTGHFTLYTSYDPIESTGASHGWSNNVRPLNAGYHYGVSIVSQRDPTMHLDGCVDVSARDWFYWRKTEYIVNGAPIADMRDQLSKLCTEETTIELAMDKTLTREWFVPGCVRKLLFTSTPGTTHALCVYAGMDFALLKTTNAATTVRFENIALRGAGKHENPLVHVLSGTVELGQGAILEKAGYGVWLEKPESYLTMEDGAVIRDCVKGDGTKNSLASAVFVGLWDTALTPENCRFDMRGGLITNCTCNTTGTSAGGYGAAVYVQNAGFVMSGGAIVGNACEHAVAGVMAWKGSITFDGDARVENNEGADDDLYVANQGNTYAFRDGFHGRVGVSGGTQSEGQPFYVKAETEGAAGAWCFFANPSAGPSGLIGMTDEATSKRVVWAMPSGTVGGVSVASAGDAARAMPKSLDVTAEWTPIAFSGCALAASGTVAVDFDPDELEAAGKVPLTLFSGEGGSFTGQLAFTLPEATRKRWAARRRGAACVLDYRKGLVLLLR